MVTDAEALAHFQQGKEVLVRRRRDLDNAIAEVDRIIAMLRVETADVGDTPARQSEPPPSTSPYRNRAWYGKPTVREALLSIMVPGSPYRVLDLRSQLAERGIEVEDKRLRAVITKMTQGGVLENVDRGVYRVKRQNADGSTSVEPSDRTHEPEGGDPDGTALTLPD